MSPGSFKFNVRPNIHYRVEIMSLVDLFSSHFLVVFAVLYIEQHTQLPESAFSVS